ncbi:PIN domain-containing protein [Microbacterium sp.]|uniref:PIN domain-containing protein n=1 Tax=Microbacterium sp. TaxID=51671 RepID=UPI002630623A|nr:PIN domain-containing protein [uncultured Microbacterium sp.]
MSRVFLVDNSVIQRLHRSDEVAASLVDLLALGELGGCLPQLLEEGYSARSGEEHRRILDANTRAKVFLQADAEVAEIAIDLQSRLFAAGLGRAVGVSDLQIAATAIRHTRGDRLVSVVHYDADFEQLAGIAPELHQQWIVPRGSVD